MIAQKWDNFLASDLCLTLCLNCGNAFLFFIFPAISASNFTKEYLMWYSGSTTGIRYLIFESPKQCLFSSSLSSFSHCETFIFAGVTQIAVKECSLFCLWDGIKLRHNPMELEDSNLQLEVVPVRWQMTENNRFFLSPRTTVLWKIGGHGIIPHQKKYQKWDI